MLLEAGFIDAYISNIPHISTSQKHLILSYASPPYLSSLSSKSHSKVFHRNHPTQHILLNTTDSTTTSPSNASCVKPTYPGYLHPPLFGWSSTTPPHFTQQHKKNMYYNKNQTHNFLHQNYRFNFIPLYPSRHAENSCYNNVRSRPFHHDLEDINAIKS